MSPVAAARATADVTARDSQARPGTIVQHEPLVPLVVDLDGSLLRTDLLIECILELVRRRPWTVPLLLLWLLRGRAYLKRRLALRAMPDLAVLPRNQAVIDYLAAERAGGRRLVLATGADRILAERIAGDPPLFDEVIASDEGRNLDSRTKRDWLVRRFGRGGFDYLGNSWRDYRVWRVARNRLIVDSGVFPAHFLRDSKVVRVFERDRAGRWPLLRALRPQHWLKNILVFVPFALTYAGDGAPGLWRIGPAFVSFCLCASSIYLLNDLLDLSADRRHPHKRQRALASGRLPLWHALAAMPLLILAALLIAWPLSAAFAHVLIAYFALMLLYSMGLKDIALLDVLILSAGYSLRVVGGAWMVGLEPSPWLVAFTMMLFFSLALIKRYAELVLMESVSATAARGYRIEERDLLAAQGVAAGYLAVMLLALVGHGVVDSASFVDRRYSWPLLGVLFYWISYLWLMARRGGLSKDPLAFAVTDRISLGLLVAMGALAVMAR